MVNPTATILSAKLMLDYLGLHRKADSLERAVVAVYRDGKSLTILGGSITVKGRPKTNFEQRFQKLVF